MPVIHQVVRVASAVIWFLATAITLVMFLSIRFKAMDANGIEKVAISVTGGFNILAVYCLARMLTFAMRSAADSIVEIFFVEQKDNFKKVPVNRKSVA